MGNLKKAKVQEEEQELNEKQRMRCILSNMRRFVALRRVHPKGAEDLINKIDEGMDDMYKGKLLAAVDEQIAIRDNTEENTTGYHLNCIHSGKIVYSVIPITYGADDGDKQDDEEDDDPCALDFDTKEEAEAAAERYDDADIIDFDPNELWAVLNRENKNELKTVFHDHGDALLALYELAKPKAFMEYMAGNPIVGMSVGNDEEEGENNA